MEQTAAPGQTGGKSCNCPLLGRHTRTLVLSIYLLSSQGLKQKHINKFRQLIV